MNCLVITCCFFAISSEELEKHEDYFVNLAISLLSAYKVLIYFLGLSKNAPIFLNNFLFISLTCFPLDAIMYLFWQKELGPSISRIGKFVENLKNLSEG